MASTQDAASGIMDEEEYVSEEDSDFHDTNDLDEDEDEDENGDDPETPVATNQTDADADDDAVLGSGDEATVRAGNQKTSKAKRRKTGDDEEGGREKKKQRSMRVKDDERSGDEDEETLNEAGFENDDNEAAGFVKTRAMRSRMKDEEKQHRLVDASNSTIDVDAIWNKLNALPASAVTESSTPEQSQQVPAEEKEAADTITIRRNYEFAGENIVEERAVSKHSAEAQLHLANGGEKWNNTASAENKVKAGDSGTEQNNVAALRRPVSRPSRFDPNPPGSIKRNWTKHDGNSRSTPMATTSTAGTALTAGRDDSDSQAPKLNTVMKSKMDWMAYVDRTGLKNDLEVHSRAKEGYLDRMEFLGRVDTKREEERRNARMKTRNP